MTSITWNFARWSEVSSHFNRALDLAPAARSALLRELEANAPEIAHAVARMLAADAAFSTDTPPNAGAALAVAFDPILPAGAELGAYAIESCLGAGGMGRVYRANRVGGDVTQAVAIKCLRFPDRDPGFTRRFLRERRILARLNHPHIARFLDTGTDVAGRPFVVLEYIDGIAITDFARGQRLSLHSRLELLLKVMRAVAYSHRQLIVHRDIKPGNVLVDADGEPHLLDFGIAKSLAPLDPRVVDNDTAIEQRAFSLTHAAPEQLRDANVGTPCDVYALGVLAYELLCGQTPLNLSGLSYSEAERQVLDVYPAPPSQRAAALPYAPDGGEPQAWAGALRGDLDNIVLHALKKEAEARYASVDAFIEDLRRFLAQEPISLRGGQRWYRMQRFIHRHRIAVALGASLALALLIGSVALWLQNRATEAQRDAAVVQRRRAEALNSLLLDAFEAADPSRNRGKDVTAREVLDQAAQRLDTETMDVATRASLLTAVADVYRTLGLFRDSASAAENATRIKGGIPALLRIRAWRSLAQAKLALNEIPGAEAALQAAQTLPLERNDRDARAEAIETGQLALRLQIARGDAEAALAVYPALYARSQQELGRDDPVTLSVGAAYAEQLRVFRRPNDSAGVVQELLSVIADPARDPVGVRLLGDQVRLARERHQDDQAVERANAYIAAVRTLYGERHLSYVSALDLLSKVERDQGHYDAAIAVHRRILEVLGAISDKPESTQRALALNNFANTLRIAGRVAEAADIAERSVAMAVATYPPGYANIAHFRTTLAEIRIDQGDLTGALEQLAASEALFAASDKGSAPGVIRACGDVLRAEALLGLGRGAEAAVELERGWRKLGGRDVLDPCRQRGERLQQRMSSKAAPLTVPSPPRVPHEKE